MVREQTAQEVFSTSSFNKAEMSNLDQSPQTCPQTWSPGSVV